MRSELHDAVDFALVLTLVNAYFHERRKEAPVLANQLEQLAGNDPQSSFSTLGLSLAEAHEYTGAVRLFQRTNELRPQTYEVHLATSAWLCITSIDSMRPLTNFR